MLTRRKPSSRQADSRRTAIAVATARFYRRAAGRITKKEARELGRLYGGDLHWRFMGSTADKLALRDACTVTPAGEIQGEGSFLRSWREHMGLVFALERRAPRRWPISDYAGPETARHMGYFFGWLGPRSGIWPGDTLAFDCAPWELTGTARGWRVACAPDCPCGRCWRPEGDGHGSFRLPTIVGAGGSREHEGEARS